MIPTIREPKKGFFSLWDAEACCLCGGPTRYWTDLPDRSPGEQVACCQKCAAGASIKQIPTKDEWFKREAAKRPRPTF